MERQYRGNSMSRVCYSNETDISKDFILRSHTHQRIEKQNYCYKIKFLIATYNTELKEKTYTKSEGEQIE